MIPLKSFGPAIIWAIGILVVTLLPGSTLPEPPDWGFSIDKIVHFTIFGMLAILTIWGYSKTNLAITKKNLLFTVTFGVLYGLLLETGQIYVPGRFFSGPDILANSLGTVLATGGFWGYLKLRW